jgi:hypothetical protein
VVYDLPLSLFLRIVECSPHSVIPEESREEAKKRGQSRYQAGLKPWLLTFRGSPEGYLSSLQQNHAPGVEVVRVVDGTRKETSVEAFYDPKDCHPFECGCYDEDPSLRLYDNYLSDFFLKSASKSILARNFRYQAAPPTSTQNRIRNLYEASHEMDMVSASGQTWEYRRRGFCSGAFYNIIHEREELERYCGCGMCYVCQCGDEKTFGVSSQISARPDATMLTNSPPRLFEQFDNLSFEPAKGHIGSVSFRTYLSVPVGQSIDKSFQDRMAYIEFAEGLRAMAVHHLDLRKTDAKASFDLYIHHGSRPRQPRTDMKPVFSLKIVRGSEGGKAIIDRIDIDENFLNCKANRGCDRCTSPPI